MSNLRQYVVVQKGLVLGFLTPQDQYDAIMRVGDRLLTDGTTVWAQQVDHPTPWVESITTANVIEAALAQGTIAEGNGNPVYLHDTYCLASRIESVWSHVMHDLLGYKDYCESTTEFNHIDYAYTKDATDECVKRGEALWKVLITRFGGADNMGEAKLTTWGGTGLDSMPKTPGPGGPGVISCITRRRELWDK